MSLIQRHRTWWPASRTFLDLLASVISGAFLHSGAGSRRRPHRRERGHMTTIPLGAKGQFTLVVQAEHLANRFKDSALPPVLATPVMIMVVENAALNAIKAYLEPGQSAVGTRVD